MPTGYNTLSSFKEWFVYERRGEWNPNNTIVVDIQPEYSSNIHFDISEFASFLSQMLSKGRKVLYFYNGETVGFSNGEDSIRRWLASALVGEDLEAYEWYDEDEYEEEDPWAAAQEAFQTFQSIAFYDKGYGFFRGWMDQGVGDHEIIQIIRAMVVNRAYDSRELPEELITKIAGEVPEYDNIYLPHIDLLQLRAFNNAFLCGGGRDECLKEVQLLMNALNIKYRLLSRFTF